PEDVTSGTAPTTETPTTPTEPTTTIAPQPLPARDMVIPAGFYLTNSFQPRFTGTFDEGWKMRLEVSDFIEFGVSDGGRELLSVLRTTRPLRRDATFPSLAEARQPSSTEAPATDPIAWLRSNSNLTVSPSTSATRAGRRGVQVDITVTGYSTDYCDGIPCAPLFRIGDSGVFTLLEGNMNRLYALDVGGAPVLIVIEAPPDRFGAFSEKAERVIATMAFQG
ncbi:MAG: hypothetical protein M3144_10755, partial [Actinomycetota bacterium]|nr:hypothetical protein [Actinomycetota bacterium]